MKGTIKAKQLKVEYKEVKSLVATYVCPTCRTYFEDHQMNERIIRFKCSNCKQALIVKEQKGD